MATQSKDPCTLQQMLPLQGVLPRQQEHSRNFVPAILNAYRHGSFDFVITSLGEAINYAQDDN